MKTFYERLLRESDAAVDDDSHWMLTMSDLMSLLLVFLIMFFLMTKKTVGTDGAVPAKTSSGPVYTEELEPFQKDIRPTISGVEERIRDELIMEIRGFYPDDQVYVNAGNREVVITMKEKVTFSPGAAVLLKGTGPILDNIARIIRRYPEYLIEIVGHTDNVPINTLLYPSNWELSVARAASVLKYFIGTHDIDPSRLSIKGNADKRPLAPNLSPENRARNRRVEIRLKKVEA